MDQLDFVVRRKALEEKFTEASKIILNSFDRAQNFLFATAITYTIMNSVLVVDVVTDKPQLSDEEVEAIGTASSSMREAIQNAIKEFEGTDWKITYLQYMYIPGAEKEVAFMLNIIPLEVINAGKNARLN